MNLTYNLVIFLIRVYTRVTCRIDAPDLQSVPQRGPLIIITNHTGQIEVPILVAYLYPRKFTGWAKAETWDNWFLRWVFTLWGAIPIHRGVADMKALKLALRALEQGYIFGLAPEGTRNKTGRLRRALPGTVIIALRSGAPILPVAHWGGEKFLSNLKRLKRTDFHIRVGKPFALRTEGVKVDAGIRQEIVDEMMSHLVRLLPADYHGEYANLGQRLETFTHYLDQLNN
ncbi:MAG: 1-acyl-sn-glycerol-3-phosphate acyltransferase [Chloroflexi bacterium]|nr:1-acyl-sn-glycerol-3-phosphate acyltransferase [Chloroflexota bacterium]